MELKYTAVVSSDSYSGWDGNWHTDYYLETEKGEDIQDILKTFDGQKVQITIETIK